MSIKLVMAMLRYRAIAERKSLLGVVTETVSGAVLCDDVDIITHCHITHYWLQILYQHTALL